MYKIIFITAFLFLMPFKAVHAEGVFNSQDSFFAGFEDLPLMEGLDQMIDEGMSFDAPEGRIAEAYAKTDSLKEKAIFSFYSKSLIQLGWKENTKKGEFTREGENLSIEVIEKEPSLVIRFSLSPAKKNDKK